MKTVVITGSTRGLGFEMAKLFKEKGLNVVLNGVNEQRLNAAVEEIESLPGDGGVTGFAGDLSDISNIKGLMAHALENFGEVDIWINNAGVNQPMKPIWELSDEEIDAVLNIDLRGAILGSKIAVLQMEKQKNGGFIYNVEGYGSNDAMMTGLSMYGTSKRAVTYFTQALAKELEEKGSNTKACRLSPGIMITDFTVQSLGGKERIELSEKTKKIYNILGDYPDVVSGFLVNSILENTKNNAKIEWLTTKKAAWRFLTAAFNKKNYFE